jgi:hypothetical protein
MKVDQLTLEPDFADGDFDIEIKPGMLVREVHYADSPNPLYVPHPETTVYRQGESLTGAAFLRGLGLRSGWLWVVMGLALIAAVLAWWLYRTPKASGPKHATGK